MFLYKLTDFSLSQIGMAFIIVGLCAAALLTILPKIITGIKNVFSTLIGITNKQLEKQKRIEQIQKNATEIEGINSKIDTLAKTLDIFIEENKKKNEEIVQSVAELDKQHAISEIKRMRKTVFNFFNDLVNGQKKTLGEFKDVIDIIADYEEMIKKYSIENNTFPEEAEYIRRKYRRLLDSDAFLKVPGAEE